MVELTYDRDARMLYAYFAEIEEGEDATQMECDGCFLLDAEQLVGLQWETAGVLLPEALRYAVGHDGVTYDQTTGMLRLLFRPGGSATEVPFPFPAIFDLDRNGRALGVEVVAEPEFELGRRLEHAEAFIVEVFGDDDDEADAEAAAAGPGTAQSVDEREAEAGPQASTAQIQADGEPAAEVEDEQPLAAPTTGMSAEVVRAGFVALLGRPNVGKSTLLNAYLGQKVSIVSPKPQTTRLPVRGILNREDAQVVFVDTPGLHTPRSGLGEFMVQAARRAIPDSDVLCFVVDASEAPGALDERIAESIKAARKPTILVLNKVDVARQADVFLQQYRELGPWDQEVAVSAKTTDGLPTLLDEIVQRLPEGPRLFPTDEVTDLTEREQVAELVREKVLLNTSEEVPHGVAVEIEEWAERGERLYIRATVNVERDSHKGILIGEGGKMLKKIGAAARYEIERLLGRQVFLDVWIKVRKDWRRDPSSLRWLGYDVKKLK
ncbi:MAG: GTPase Era [Chloroflexota bacterium]|nr:GTPase Era [Chloroflexota bacterium]